MIEQAVPVFLGAFLALLLDRTLGAAVQLWAVRRSSVKLMRSADQYLERVKGQHLKKVSGGRMN